MLVRDAPSGDPDAADPHIPDSGLEVFLLRRNLRSVFVGGAYVFPGGAVDPGDRDPDALALVHGLDAVRADEQLGIGPDALRFWVAAIRESFEEGGVLLARDATTGQGVDPRLSDRLAPERAAIASGEASFAAMIARESMVLDAGELRPFGRWITPSPAPRRYDTWFFVAPAPSGHAYAHDSDETVASEWMRPGDALARAGRDEIELIYPTFRSLQALSRFRDTRQLFDAVDRTWRDAEPALRVVNPGLGWQLRLPGDVEGTGAVDQEDVDALAYSTTHRPTAGAR